MLSIPRLEIKNLVFTYGDTRVFDNFSIASDAPVIVLRGPSGCGKTTLLKLLTGFLLSQGLSELPLACSPALIIQEDGLFPWMTGRGSLSLGGRLVWADACNHRLYPMVEPLLRQRCFRMSYGQRRKVELFGAFLRRHDLLCLDEPFNFIDQSTRATMIDFINKGALADRLVVMSSHYESDIAGLDCDVIEFDGDLPISACRHYAYSAGTRLSTFSGITHD